MRPYQSYILGKEIKKQSAVVTTTSVEETMQKYEVLEVGPGAYTSDGFFVEPSVKKGDVVYIQKHAEADTPEELKEKGHALFLDSRIMAVEGK